MSTFCSLVYGMRKILAINSLMKMYKVYFEPIITYEILIYGTASKTDSQRIHSKQEKKSNSSWTKKIDPMPSILDLYFILMPQELYVMELSIFLKHCVNGFFRNSSLGNRWMLTAMISPGSFYNFENQCWTSLKKVKSPNQRSQNSCRIDSLFKTLLLYIFIFSSLFLERCDAYQWFV